VKIELVNHIRFDNPLWLGLSYPSITSIVKS